MRWPRSRSGAVVVLSLVFSACIASAPSLRAVRWFDPLPATSAGATTAGSTLRVTAAPHLAREFVVRISAREVAFDSEHQWIVEPRLLLATVLANVDVVGAKPDDHIEVSLEAFELDVTAAPRAHVRFVVQGVAAVAARTIDVYAPSADRSPEAFAAAMATALEQARAAFGSAP